MRILLQAGVALCVSALGTARVSPTPATDRRSPVSVDYTLHVDSSDLSGVSVEMRIHAAPADFRVAMVFHTEYDDEYWRHLTNLRGESPRGAVVMTREDSSLWRVAGPDGEVMLRYRVQYPPTPPMQQASWKAHLTPTGGLIGGPHSFLYVVGAERAPVRVTLELPTTWQVATGLASAGVPRTYSAPGIEALTDSPMLVGLLRNSQFAVDGVPHHIAFLGRSGGTPFDTARFAGAVERIARETVHTFKGMPYREYWFLFEDGTFGGLEHLNSVSIGTQSSNLTRDPDSYLGQISHEFVHTWNEVNIRPVSWIGVRHVAPEPTGELWWSEGVTLYFADLVLRRAGLNATDSTRVAHLERYIGSYFANPSHGLVSPEATSRAFNKPPNATGDYTPSMFTQGELLGAMLDLVIRDATHGARSLDDAMRSMSAGFTPERGFTGADVEHAVAEACACEVRPFFDKYVRAAGALDFGKYLRLVGLRAAISWVAALAADGTPAPDARLSAFNGPDGTAPQLKIWFPATLWGQAGMHTGDHVEKWNGEEVRNAAQLRALIGRLRIGDTVRVSVRRGAAAFEKAIVVTGYQRPTVKMEARPDASDSQRRLLAQWVAGR